VCDERPQVSAARTVHERFPGADLLLGIGLAGRASLLSSAPAGTHCAGRRWRSVRAARLEDGPGLQPCADPEPGHDGSGADGCDWRPCISARKPAADSTCARRCCKGCSSTPPRSGRTSRRGRPAFHEVIGQDLPARDIHQGMIWPTADGYCTSQCCPGSRRCARSRTSSASISPAPSSRWGLGRSAARRGRSSARPRSRLGRPLTWRRCCARTTTRANRSSRPKQGVFGTHIHNWRPQHGLPGTRS